ncbi:MAG: addiction module toxin RelE [Desulfuromonadales bacterium C00003068]|nr:MAG: addiction module toxin RelE [Desulfuromonadales bacterium C00003068]
MGWQIEFSKTSIKQLKKLDPQVRRKIVSYLKEKVTVAPSELGAPLRNELSGFWKYRVADYRIICEHQDDKLVVLVLRVGHRKEVYRN